MPSKPGKYMKKFQRRTENKELLLLLLNIMKICYFHCPNSLNLHTENFLSYKICLPAVNAAAEFICLSCQSAGTSFMVPLSSLHQGTNADWVFTPSSGCCLLPITILQHAALPVLPTPGQFLLFKISPWSLSVVTQGWTIRQQAFGW